MANEEHVAVLEQGVQAWNRWREDNPEITPDLRELAHWPEAMQGPVLEEMAGTSKTILPVNLSGAQLRNADLRGAVLAMADLREARMYGAHVEGADLRGADLSNTLVAEITYDRTTKCRGIRAVTCYGSQMFKTFVQDEDYLEEFQAMYPGWYKLWLWSSDCGRSFLRLAAIAFAIVVACAVLYRPAPFWTPDWWVAFVDAWGPRLEQTASAFAGQPLDFWSSLYFSIVTFTTLGYGDVVAANWQARVLVTVEVMLGYLMLGSLISILANKLARRA